MKCPPNGSRSAKPRRRGSSRAARLPVLVSGLGGRAHDPPPRGRSAASCSTKPTWSSRVFIVSTAGLVSSSTCPGVPPPRWRADRQPLDRAQRSCRSGIRVDCQRRQHHGCYARRHHSAGGAPAAPRDARVDGPDRGSSHGLPVEGKPESDDTRSAGTGPPNDASRPAPGHPARPVATGSPTPTVPPRARRTRGGRTDRVIGYTRPAAGARVRLPFFRVISLRTSISRSRSATIFFRRPFSCSSWRTRLTSDGSKLPKCFR